MMPELLISRFECYESRNLQFNLHSLLCLLEQNTEFAVTLYGEVEDEDVIWYQLEEVHATLFKNAVVFRVVNYELVFPTELYIEGLGYGNLLEEEAISLLNMVKTIFSGQPLPTKLMLKNNCICLAPDANLIRDVSV